MFEKLDYVKAVKISVGAGMAMALAGWLGLNYSASAGIIALLSIRDTKRETIRVTVRRLYSFGLALALSAACFAMFGYGVLAVGVFLLLFSSGCMVWHMQEGISVNAVLVTHFFTEQSMALGDIGNELALLVIGESVGVLLNLYIPGKMKQIRAKQRQVEEQMKSILSGMAGKLSGGEGPGAAEELLPESNGDTAVCLAKLFRELKQGERNAYEDMENKLLTETRYYIQYMNMRKLQSLVLEKIAGLIARLRAFPPQSRQIADLMDQISARFHEYNNALRLLEKLEQVKQSMRNQPLPAGRKEFESRAILFLILLELEQFLTIKKEFVEELTEEEIGQFWEGGGALSEGK